MIRGSLGALPAQHAVPSNKLDAFRLTVDSAIQGVKRLEDLPGSPSGLFLACPVITHRLPALEHRWSCRIIRKSRHARFGILLGLIPGFLDGGVICRIVPAGFQPFGNFTRRGGRSSERRALNLQNKGYVTTLGALAVGGCSFRGPRFRRSALNRRMLGEVV